MNLLITAGNTQSMIDRVRCVTNIFSGRTGASLARAAWSRGHTVTLATSAPASLTEFGIDSQNPSERFAVLPYRTFDDLAAIMQDQLGNNSFDAVCHSAAVSDYLPAGTYAPAAGTFFNTSSLEWHSGIGPAKVVEQSGGKIKSSEPELWLRLVRAPKLIDSVRQPWGFAGVLVKFKLEVGIDERQLVEVAEASRQHSRADFIVANTLEGARDWAWLGPVDGSYERVPRNELPERLLLAIEHRHKERFRNG